MIEKPLNLKKTTPNVLSVLLFFYGLNVKCFRCRNYNKNKKTTTGEQLTAHRTYRTLNFKFQQDSSRPRNYQPGRSTVIYRINKVPSSVIVWNRGGSSTVSKLLIRKEILKVWNMYTKYCLLNNKLGTNDIDTLQI